MAGHVLLGARMSTSGYALLRSVLVTSLVTLTAGCAATSDAGDEDYGEVVNAEDAMTAEERAEGALARGDHDELSPEEEAELAKAVDDSNDPGPPADDLAPAPAAQSLQPLAGAGCTNTTGYENGRARKICVTTVGGKQVEINTAKAFVRMRDAAKRDGVTLVVVSGFRTMQKQRELYRLFKAGRGNPANPPGYSNHQNGLALDLNARAPGVYSWLTRNGGKFGFIRTVPRENWHWEKRR
jgi:LAS superfamily LD-carboxypeptidase LdcB